MLTEELVFNCIYFRIANIGEATMRTEESVFSYTYFLIANIA